MGSLGGVRHPGAAESAREGEQRKPCTTPCSLNDKHPMSQEADLLALRPGFVIYGATWARPSSLPLCVSVSSL